MPNTLIIPNSGTIYFSTETAGASTIPSLTGQAVSLAHDGQAGLVVSSLNTSTSATNRFRVNGANGALLAVTDEVTGTVFSVNDPAGLPIISADTGLNDVITIGTFGSNALVVRNDRVGVGTSNPSTSAALEIVSTTKGFLPPRMTTTERNAITSPPAGLVIYNTTTNNLNSYSGSAWVELVDSADLGTNVANFLATPTSANLASALTDENGTGGGFVRAEGATLTSPALVGPVNLTSQDSSTADRVMNRSLSDTRVIKNRVEGKARVFTLMNLPNALGGSVNQLAFPSYVEMAITAANTHSGYLFCDLSPHNDWSGAGFNFARNFLCSGVFFLRAIGDQNGSLRFFIGAPASYRSNQASLSTAGLCLEFRRNGSNLEARLAYYATTYIETAWVTAYATSTYFNSVFRFVVRNTGNGNVDVYFLASGDIGSTKPLPNIDGTPLISVTNGPTISGGRSLVAAFCADTTLTPSANNQARVQHFDLELLS